jgi:hypothetical protein
VEHVELVVVVTLASASATSAALETLESIDACTTRSRAVVVADHSGRGHGRHLRALRPEVQVSEMGPDELLDDRRVDPSYLHLARVIKEVLRGRQFDALLQIRAGVVLAGRDLASDAIASFERDPLVGAAGSIELGQVATGASARTKLRAAIASPRSTVADPRGWLGLCRVVARAHRNGYRAGERVDGRMCFYSYTGLKALAVNRYLPKMSLARTGLGGDEIFALTLRASGYHFAPLNLGSR